MSDEVTTSTPDAPTKLEGHTVVALEGTLAGPDAVGQLADYLALLAAKLPVK